MKWFKVELHSDGTVKTCTPSEQPSLVRVSRKVFLVQAADPAAATAQARKHWNLYASELKRVANERNRAAGNCRCGRKKDRARPDSGFYSTCAVCSVRQVVHNERYEARKAAGAPLAQRDERARVEACTLRVRDRKAEMRLETLLEVQRAWEGASNNQAFTRWLREELAKALAPRTAEAVE